MIQFEAFFRISYGMYIVTSGNSSRGNGFISNAVMQVSSSPAIFVVCSNKENYTSQIISETGAFAISVIDQDADIGLIGTFGYKSGKNVDKLAGRSISYGITGVPVVRDQCLAYIECRLEQSYDVGSHWMFTGKVVKAEVIAEGTPLAYNYYREVRKGNAPKNAPTYIDKNKIM